MNSRVLEPTMAATVTYWRERISQLPQERPDRIRAIQGLLHAGVYDTEERLEETIRRLDRELFPDGERVPRTMEFD